MKASDSVVNTVGNDFPALTVISFDLGHVEPQGPAVGGEGGLRFLHPHDALGEALEGHFPHRGAVILHDDALRLDKRVGPLDGVSEQSVHGVGVGLEAFEVWGHLVVPF
ncbi:hypothetical protein [Sphingomonas phage Carli]|nr:hypothetical protein [Sphingomonas phage Carli]